ncbi:MAG TPA: hypothetical protein VN698_09230 [Bacteroidia bacterium]|nr:hypothetical protein [Bacteroidia bacterium]
MFNPFAISNKVPTQLPNLKAVSKKINNSRKYQFKPNNNQLHASILQGNFKIEMVYSNLSLNENQLTLQTGFTKAAVFLFMFCWPIFFLGITLYNLKGNYYQNLNIMGIGVGATFAISYIISLIVMSVINYNLKQELKKYGVI